MPRLERNSAFTADLPTFHRALGRCDTAAALSFDQVPRRARAEQPAAGTTAAVSGTDPTQPRLQGVEFHRELGKAQVAAPVVKRLHDKRIVASSTPYGTSYARLAPGLLGSPPDVETVLREILAL